MAIGTAGAVAGTVIKGLPLAIEAANGVLAWVTRILGVTSKGLEDVNAARMSPEEYAEAMAKVTERLGQADAILGPLREQMRAKQDEVDEPWDPRLRT